MASGPPRWRRLCPRVETVEGAEGVSSRGPNTRPGQRSGSEQPGPRATGHRRVAASSRGPVPRATAGWQRTARARAMGHRRDGPRSRDARALFLPWPGHPEGGARAGAPGTRPSHPHSRRQGPCSQGCACASRLVSSGVWRWFSVRLRERESGAFRLRLFSAEFGCLGRFVSLTEETPG